MNMISLDLMSSSVMGQVSLHVVAFNVNKSVSSLNKSVPSLNKSVPSLNKPVSSLNMPVSSQCAR
ncbi:hypothetical protein EJF18_50368 [Clavispora lusitaniae]|uniref:Uncharacterized protein n=2 Tax=Clavispora lusitaniae TaxID=36911 RepID=A0ACD0WP60_CLALS|nr:hypothetical protein A9F13_04g00407 [Clavispora lusitaniae]QFZ29139.1 hypothetical protein EJF14_50368 [Clavispora lusitaniae]QFZ34802.1 hypothetical protein EJF16_50368 [Clavispora lusitaniae]QFZ40487.1 hypothetical protein EJF15_50368 [Clavispora lusitaniae]QFZ46167.1 hypothetical protein EJF18_50368 [Clavispora lusitaniae]